MNRGLPMVCQDGDTPPEFQLHVFMPRNVFGTEIPEELQAAIEKAGRERKWRRQDHVDLEAPFPHKQVRENTVRYSMAQGVHSHPRQGLRFCPK